MKGRSFSNSSTQKVAGRSAMVRGEKKLPWLASTNDKKAWIKNESPAKSSHSSWEVSAKRLEKVSTNSSWEESAKRLDDQRSESSRDGFAKRSSTSLVGNRESRNRVVDVVEDHQTEYTSWENVEEEKEEDEAVDDPRWDKIKNRFRGVVDVKDGYEK